MICLPKDLHWLFDFSSLIQLTDKENGLNTDFQGKNKAVIKIIGTINYFEGKLNQWKTQLMKVS